MKLSGSSNEVALVISVDEDRIGAIIGTKGKVERDIEQRLGVKIKVIPDKGKVIVVADRDKIENAWRAKMIIEAIAHGISYDYARRLIDDSDYVLEVIDISEYARHRRDLQRIKGRLIGTHGKVKTRIEEELNVRISIRDRYVAILGKYDDVGIAKEAIKAICRGSKYSNVMRKIEEYKMSKLFMAQESWY